MSETSGAAVVAFLLTPRSFPHGLVQLLKSEFENRGNSYRLP